MEVAGPPGPKGSSVEKRYYEGRHRVAGSHAPSLNSWEPVGPRRDARDGGGHAREVASAGTGRLNSGLTGAPSRMLDQCDHDGGPVETGGKAIESETPAQPARPGRCCRFLLRLAQGAVTRRRRKRRAWAERNSGSLTVTRPAVFCSPVLLQIAGAAQVVRSSVANTS